MEAQNKPLKFPPQGNWALVPTPLQKLERLSQELGVNIFVKREDCTGLEWSGNKIRKLNFLVQEALNKKCDTLITCGGIQSNHCRATAALAAKLGLRCVLLLRGEKPSDFKSNNLMSQLFGAEIFYLTNEQYYNQGEIRMALEAQIRQRGGKAYYIPEGGSNGLGAFGYWEVFREIEAQLKGENSVGQWISPASLPEHFDSILCAHGSGGTQAGLILGKIASNSDTRVIGVNVCYDAKESFRLVKEVLWAAIQQYQLSFSFLAEDIEMLDGFVGKGYAQSRPEELRFLRQLASMESLLLDPVYTGKAFYGMVETVKKKPDFFGKNILFLHTGGTFGNFKENEAWKDAF